MKDRYCLTGNVKDIREIYYDIKKTGNIKNRIYLENRAMWNRVNRGLTVTFFNQAGSEPVEIYRKTKSKDELNMVMEKLAYQCGMVFKSTEASLLSTGMQPFIVQISVNG